MSACRSTTGVDRRTGRFRARPLPDGERAVGRDDLLRGRSRCGHVQGDQQYRRQPGGPVLGPDDGLRVLLRRDELLRRRGRRIHPGQSELRALQRPRRVHDVLALRPRSRGHAVERRGERHRRLGHHLPGPADRFAHLDGHPHHAADHRSAHHGAATTAPPTTAPPTTAPPTTAPPTTTPPSSGLLVNGGFETGSLSPWTCQSGSAVVTSPVHSGSYSLEVAPGSSTTGECDQTVTLKPDTSYSLTGWVQGNYAYLGVSGGATASTWTSSSGWKQLTVPFTTGSSGTVTVYVHGWYAQGNVFADDLSIS
ncbi:hypothetical protein GXW82_42670 [Streptacidiphilus sp. 4-A2]|nr:hypothetical protein [Streptacidiphilus sp. 4-A2]